MPIEKTSKPIKLAQLLAWLTILGSGAGGVYVGGDQGLRLGLIGAGGGIAASLVLRFIAWWQYG
jgi:hypothetical protein